jgi:hypothetical protein
VPIGQFVLTVPFSLRFRWFRRETGKLLAADLNKRLAERGIASGKHDAVAHPARPQQPALQSQRVGLRRQEFMFPGIGDRAANPLQEG